LASEGRNCLRLDFGKSELPRLISEETQNLRILCFKGGKETPYSDTRRRIRSHPVVWERGGGGCKPDEFLSVPHHQFMPYNYFKFASHAERWNLFYDKQVPAYKILRNIFEFFI